MKKTFMLLFLILVLIPVFALDATVVSVLGKAEVQTAKGWEPMKTGEKIAEGAVISTGFKSQAVLEIGKSKITVQPLSRLTVEQLTARPDSDHSKVYLDAGSIKADIKAAENKRVGFTVKSPVATASVRGTAGTIDAFGTLESTSGIWAVVPGSDETADAPEIQVAKGSGIAVSENGTVTPPQQYNMNAAVSANPVAVLPSAAEVSGAGLPSASAAAQAATAAAEAAGKAPVKITVGWGD
ncbi:FecR domain-containing protein [Treponema sp. HNW]|uniref:FecR domain-containing protein n=1 Tax=Treponema sp. HNW TaxID=3116654 RepID=UPI003D0AFF0A